MGYGICIQDDWRVVLSYSWQQSEWASERVNLIFHQIRSLPLIAVSQRIYIHYIPTNEHRGTLHCTLCTPLYSKANYCPHTHTRANGANSCSGRIKVFPYHRLFSMRSRLEMPRKFSVFAKHIFISSPAHECVRRLVRMTVFEDEDNDDDDDAFTIIFAKAALLFLDNQADEHQPWGWMA